jgi:sugar-phosphatase
MIKAVIFDMDGIIIDSEPLWREAEKQVFKSIGYDFTDEMCKLTMGMRTTEVVEYWYQELKWTDPSIKEVENNILQTVHRLIMDKGEAMNGLYELLSYLKSKNITTALASSSHQFLIDAVVDKLNIKNEFNAIHSAEKLKYGKPHPEIFMQTATALNINPLNCLVIEDSINGVIAAKAALMKVVAIPDEEQKNNPKFLIADYVLENLEAVKALSII